MQQQLLIALFILLSKTESTTTQHDFMTPVQIAGSNSIRTTELFHELIAQLIVSPPGK